MPSVKGLKHETLETEQMEKDRFFKGGKILQTKNLLFFFFFFISLFQMIIFRDVAKCYWIFKRFSIYLLKQTSSATAEISHV